MNQYLLLLGPALGFVLGVFFTWFLTYSRMRQVEKNAADEKKQLETSLDQAKQNETELALARSSLEQAQSQACSLKEEIEKRSQDLKRETELRLTLEERVKKIEILEKVINDLKKFEHDVVALREKNQAFELAISEKKAALKEAQNEIETLRNDLKISQEKADAQIERLKDLAVVRERAKKLEEENCNLLKENEQLRNIEAHLRQITEIKELYSRTVEENQSFRNQDIARHFIQIKQGLQQSIKAYNRMLHLVNNPLLEDSSIIEIDNESPVFSEEEMLESVETDTADLEKIDGEKR